MSECEIYTSGFVLNHVKDCTISSTIAPAVWGSYFKCLDVCSLLSGVKREPVQNERHCGDLVVLCDCNWDSSVLIYPGFRGFPEYLLSDPDPI